jgi:hypothetical protein
MAITMNKRGNEEYKKIRADIGRFVINYIPVAGNLLSGDSIRYHGPVPVFR